MAGASPMPFGAALMAKKKGECKMREWKREGYTVEERSFGYSLHCFAVLVEGKDEQIIYPDSIESMNSIIADLDAGADVSGWEDDMGNTIYTDPELLSEGKDDFEEMVRDWRADHAEEMSDLEIDNIEFEDGEWVAYCHDEKNAYSISDDGTGNLAINYIGSR